MTRNLVYLRKSYKYFNKNKNWILAILFVCSIIKDNIWYSCFGVNILAYSSLQDTFISFFNYLLIFVVLALNYVMWMLSLDIIGSRTKFERILFRTIQILGIVILSGIYFLLFKKIISLIGIIFIFYIIYLGVKSKNFAHTLNFSIFLILTLSTIEPISQYHLILNDKLDKRTNGVIFKLKESNTEFFSFEYNSKKFNTSEFKYYLVGNTSDYFFIYDRKIDGTLIIPKSSCINIKNEVFNVANYFR